MTSQNIGLRELRCSRCYRQPDVVVRGRWANGRVGAVDYRCSRHAPSTEEIGTRLLLLERREREYTCDSITELQEFSLGFPWIGIEKKVNGVGEPR